MATFSGEDLTENVDFPAIHRRELREGNETSRSMERTVHSVCEVAVAEQVDDNPAVPGVHDARGSADVRVQSEPPAADDCGELRGLGQHRDEFSARPLVGREGGEVEPEEAGRVGVAEAAEEGGVGGGPEPAPADGGGADEVGGEPEAEEDLGEEVAVAEHHRDRRRGRRREGGFLPFHLRLHCWADTQAPAGEEGWQWSRGVGGIGGGGQCLPEGSLHIYNLARTAHELYQFGQLFA